MKVLRAIIGGFIAAILINSSWGVFTEELGDIGGILVAAILVGTMWLLNHGLGLIVQSGKVWIDMALAVATGVLVATTLEGNNIKESIPTLMGCCIGGIIAGIVLANL